MKLGIAGAALLIGCAGHAAASSIQPEPPPKHAEWDESADPCPGVRAARALLVDLGADLDGGDCP